MAKGGRESAAGFEGLLDQVGEVAEEACGARAVEGAVVTRQRQHHGRPDGGLTIERDDPVGDAADGEDRRLRRVDDGVEGIDAEHAEVADGEGAALDIGGPELTALRAGDRVLAAGGDCREPQGVGAVGVLTAGLVTRQGA